ncbi:MAG: methyltransferase domain-containing protein [Ktedonobacteraceae bacterium]|nr:methyltransferase domain-containing protein [Ktedonobacteraceae bacterium]
MLIQRFLSLLPSLLMSRTIKGPPEESTFVEIGPGDCALSFAVAHGTKKVYAVDVSTEITASQTCPPNFALLLSDGCSIPLPDRSVAVVYSHQLMEHLYPDDALEQLEQVYRVLIPYGIGRSPEQIAAPTP